MTEHVHDKRFDGDDPYLVCHECGQRWDSRSGDPWPPSVVPRMWVGSSSPRIQDIPPTNGTADCALCPWTVIGASNGDEAELWLADHHTARHGGIATLRFVSEELDRALQAALDARSVAEPVWQERRGLWVPVEVFAGLTPYLPCPMRSSITVAPCVLTWGHEPYSAERFHKFGAKATETPEEYMQREGWQYMGSASDDA